MLRAYRRRKSANEKFEEFVDGRENRQCGGDAAIASRRLERLGRRGASDRRGRKDRGRRRAKKWKDKAGEEKNPSGRREREQRRERPRGVDLPKWLDHRRPTPRI